MVRRELLGRFGPEVYSDGYVVHTTLDGHLQNVAHQALRSGLMGYDRRHGLRPWQSNIWAGSVADSQPLWLDALQKLTSPGGAATGLRHRYRPESDRHFARRRLSNRRRCGPAGLPSCVHISIPTVWGSTPADAGEVVKPGDLVRVRETENGWQLAQIPTAQAALVSINADDGAIRAVVGGFDFFASKFNRVTQATRLPGSNIKPFIYAGALEQGFTPASRINDAPIVFNDRELEEALAP